MGFQYYIPDFGIYREQSKNLLNLIRFNARAESVDHRTEELSLPIDLWNESTNFYSLD